MKKYIISLFVILFLMQEASAKEAMIPISPLKLNEQQDAKKDGVEVDDIYVACKYYFSKLFSTRENIARKNICNGYFFGSVSMLLLLQSDSVKTNTCIPMDISTEEVIKGFIKWVENNPKKNKMLASEALLEMIRQEYPCDTGYVPKAK